MIERGTILYSENLFYEIPHGKFFVVIGETDDAYVGFFFINSRINENDRTISKEDIYRHQFPLQAKNYQFLKYDSFLDCKKIPKPISKTIIEQSIHNKETLIRGHLIDNDIENILILVRNSKLYSLKEKQTFFK